MKNLKKLTRKDLISISGGDIPFAICDADGNCPPGFPSGGGNSYCSGGICYRTSPGGGGPGGGCIEHQHLCQSWETGCGCVYL